VRGQRAAAVLEPATPVDETEVAETPVPLPLVLVLVILALASLITSYQNPLNGVRPLSGGNSPIAETRKAISFSRVEVIGQVIEEYNDANGRLPPSLNDLVPNYISASMLVDPWGHEYGYLPQPERFLVIGLTPDRRNDPDLLLSRMIGAPVTSSPKQQQTGGIKLLD
jgi:hypothetical protein